MDESTRSSLLCMDAPIQSARCLLRSVKGARSQRKRRPATGDALSLLRLLRNPKKGECRVALYDVVLRSDESRGHLKGRGGERANVAFGGRVYGNVDVTASIGDGTNGDTSVLLTQEGGWRPHTNLWLRQADASGQ
jgi:hypothetical protein